MGLIKEPVNVDFTVISKAWTAEEEKEFSELIKKQKEAYNKKRMPLSVSSRIVPAKRMPTVLRRKKVVA
jgi:hypothetical protein